LFFREVHREFRELLDPPARREIREIKATVEIPGLRLSSRELSPHGPLAQLLCLGTCGLL
jgi:hypothetical protein